MPSNSREAASPNPALPVAPADEIMGLVEFQFQRLFAADIGDAAPTPEEAVANSE